MRAPFLHDRSADNPLKKVVVLYRCHLDVGELIEWKVLGEKMSLEDEARIDSSLVEMKDAGGSSPLAHPSTLRRHLLISTLKNVEFCVDITR